MTEEFIRIGEKVVSLDKILGVTRNVLQLRANGLSQKQVAAHFKLDRTFISRLESIGEIRKGRKVALIGFPLQNKEEIKDIARDKGLDFTWVMNEEERWQMVKETSAIDFFNHIMDTITQLQAYDVIIIIASRKWKKLAEALFPVQVVFMDLGNSPIEEDRLVNTEELCKTLEKVIIY